MFKRFMHHVGFGSPDILGLPFLVDKHDHKEDGFCKGCPKHFKPNMDHILSAEAHLHNVFSCGHVLAKAEPWCTVCIQERKMARIINALPVEVIVSPMSQELSYACPKMDQCACWITSNLCKPCSTGNRRKCTCPSGDLAREKFVENDFIIYKEAMHGTGAKNGKNWVVIYSLVYFQEHKVEVVIDPTTGKAVGPTDRKTCVAFVNRVCGVE